MARDTKLRLLGGCILLINLVLIGHYDLQGLPVLLLTFGFAAGYEYLIVRRAIFPLKESTADSPNEHPTPKAPNPASSPWWKWILPMGGMLLLIKLIGPLPGFLSVLCYAWLKRRMNTLGAVAGSAIVGLCLVAIVAGTLPTDPKPGHEAAAQPKPWTMSWEEAAVTRTSEPVPNDQGTPTTAGLVDSSPLRHVPSHGEVVPPQLGQSTVSPSAPPQDQVESHYAAIYAAHPDADQIFESASFIQWLSTRPNYQHAMQKGTANQVIEAFSAFKAQQTR